jgi:hypothetical protein
MTRLAAAFLGLLLLCAPAAPAAAQILFAGGEDVDFTPVPSCGGSCNVDTNSSHFRSAWARADLHLGGSGADPSPYRYLSATFANSSTIWVHAQVTNSGTNTFSNGQYLIVYGSDGNPAILIRGTGTAGQVMLSKRSVGGTFTDLVTCTSGAFPTTSVDQMDLYLNYSTSGEVALYRNSVSICDKTGDVTTDGRTSVNQIALASGTGNVQTDTYWSEVIVATTDTRAMNLYTLVPNGNAPAIQWANSSGTTPCTSLLGQTSINHANYVYAASTPLIEECTVAASIPPGSFTVPALVMSMNGLVGASGPQHFKFLTHIGSTDYASGNFAPTNSFSNIGNYIQTTNPATSNPWATTDLTAASFYIGLESEP